MNKRKVKVCIGAVVTAFALCSAFAFLGWLLNGFDLTKFTRGFFVTFMLLGGPLVVFAAFVALGLCPGAEYPCCLVLWYGTGAIGLLVSKHWSGSTVTPYLIGLAIAGLACFPTAKIARKLSKGDKGGN